MTVAQIVTIIGAVTALVTAVTALVRSREASHTANVLNNKLLGHLVREHPSEAAEPAPEQCYCGDPDCRFKK